MTTATLPAELRQLAKYEAVIRDGEQLRKERLNSPEADGAGLGPRPPLASKQGHA